MRYKKFKNGFKSMLTRTADSMLLSLCTSHALCEFEAYGIGEEKRQLFTFLSQELVLVHDCSDAAPAKKSIVLVFAFPCG